MPSSPNKGFHILVELVEPYGVIAPESGFVGGRAGGRASRWVGRKVGA